VPLTLIAMEQEYQARHANVEDTIRKEVYGIREQSIPLYRATVQWFQGLWQITDPKRLGELVSGTVQVCAMTIFFE
jgi:hypothetical protein